MAEILIAVAIAAAVSAASYTLSYVLRSKPKPTERGRLQGQLQIQDSSYGNRIPWIVGGDLGDASAHGIRVAGNVIYMSDIRKVEVVTPGTGGGGGGGGKGGGGGQPGTREITYYVDVGICFGQPGEAAELDLRQLFASSDLVYDVRGVVPPADGCPTGYHYDELLGTCVPNGGGGGGGGGGGEGGCFLAGTPITLANDVGRKTIEFVRPNDLVKSFVPATGEYITGCVTWTRQRWVDSHLLIYLEDKTRLAVTDEHPFYQPTPPDERPRLHDWFLCARDLRAGDILQTEHGPVIINQIMRVPGRVLVYNFNVEGQHTYIADGVLVHNVKPADRSGAVDATFSPDAAYDYMKPPDPYDGNLLNSTTYRFGDIPTANGRGEVSATIVNGGYAALRWYPGNELQEPDPLITGEFQQRFPADYALGRDVTPAYRDRGYVVLQNFNISKYGVLPNFTGVFRNTTIITAAQILSAAAALSGVNTSTELDVSALTTKKVRGMAVVNRASVRQISADTLARRWPFDWTQTGGKLTTVMRGGAAVYDVPANHLGWHAAGSKDDAPTRVGVKEQLSAAQLPRRVEVKAFDVGHKLEIGTGSAKRQVVQSKTERIIEIDMALSVPEMREIAQRELDTAWLEERQALVVSLPGAAYADLVPTQVITINDGGSPTAIIHSMRIREITGAVPGALEVVGVPTDAALYVEHVLEPPTEIIGDVPVPPTVIGTFVDSQYLRDRDAYAGRLGYYVGCTSLGNGIFSGAQLWRDRGQGYEFVADFTVRATMGRTVSAMNSGSTTVQVDLYGDATLESYSSDDAENGKGWVLCGGEALQYTTATPVGGFYNRWELGGFYTRGGKGTEAYLNDHTTNERFVLLDGALRFVSVDLAEYGKPRPHKFFANGMLIDDVAPVSFIWTGAILARAPTGIICYRDADKNAQLTIPAPVKEGKLFPDANNTDATSAEAGVAGKFVRYWADVLSTTGVAFTASSSTNLCTATAHGLSDGTRLALSNTGGLLPNPLRGRRHYYVRDATTNTFALCLVVGGDVIDLADAGTGTHFFTLPKRHTSVTADFAQPAILEGAHFYDDFNNNSQATDQWAQDTVVTTFFDTLVTVTETNRQLQIALRASQTGDHFNGYLLNNPNHVDFSLDGSTVAVALLQTPAVNANARAGLTLGSADGTNRVALYYTNGNLVLERLPGPATASLAYNATTHKYFRIRYNAGTDTLKADTSPDNVTWTERLSLTRGTTSLSDVRLAIEAGTTGSVTTPGTAIFDDFDFRSGVLTETAGTGGWLKTVTSPHSNGSGPGTAMTGPTTDTAPTFRRVLGLIEDPGGAVEFSWTVTNKTLTTAWNTRVALMNPAAVSQDAALPPLVLAGKPRSHRLEFIVNDIVAEYGGNVGVPKVTLRFNESGASQQSNTNGEVLDTRYRFAVEHGQLLIFRNYTGPDSPPLFRSLVPVSFPLQVELMATRREKLYNITVARQRDVFVFNYPVADQILDFGSAPATVRFRVYEERVAQGVSFLGDATDFTT